MRFQKRLASLNDSELSSAYSSDKTSRIERRIKLLLIAINRGVDRKCSSRIPHQSSTMCKRRAHSPRDEHRAAEDYCNRVFSHQRAQFTFICGILTDVGRCCSVLHRAALPLLAVEAASWLARSVGAPR